jgi:hypothetical protein
VKGGGEALLSSKLRTSFQMQNYFAPPVTSRFVKKETPLITWFFLVLRQAKKIVEGGFPYGLLFSIVFMYGLIAQKRTEQI